MRKAVALAVLFLTACGSSPRRRPADAGARADAARPDAARPDTAGGPADVAAAPDLAPDVHLVPDLAPPTLLPEATMAIAGELHGAFLELECASEEFEFQFCIPKEMGRKSIDLRFGGEPGKAYTVVLKVWGVMETIKYKDGTLAGPGFYVGGVPETPATAEYGLEIAGQTYYVNYMEIGAGEHYTYGIQYQAPPITIPGRATIRLFVRDPDNYVNTNHMQSEVTEPPPRLREQLKRILAQTVQGQFVYLEVASAVAK